MAKRKIGGLGGLGGATLPLMGDELLAMAALNGGPQARAHDPSLRERLGNFVYDAVGGLGGLGGIQNRMREEAQIGMDFIPGLGEAVGADDTARAFNSGNYLDAAVSGGATALGTLPVGGDIAGGVLKAIFGGVGAKTADKLMLNKAQDLAAKGADRGAVWRETGWFQGSDGKWRFEIDDSPSKLTPKAAEELMAHGGGSYGATQRTAAGVLMHPEMYAAYPELRAIDIDARYNSALRSPNGAYVANAPGNGGRSKIELQANSLEGPHNSVRGMGLHEMQHAIQSAENFVPGSNPNYGHAIEDQWAAAREAYEESKGLAGGMSDDELLAELTGRTFEKKPTKSWDELTKREQLEWLERGRGRLYHHNAGEVEARNVQSRMNLTPAQRRETPPWETQDVPDELQIIRHR